jgi:hypothetical protein
LDQIGDLIGEAEEFYYPLYYSLVCSFGLIDFEGSSLEIYWLEV